MASFTKEVKSRLTKRPLDFNGRLASRGLYPLVKEATDALKNTRFLLKQGIMP